MELSRAVGGQIPASWAFLSECLEGAKNGRSYLQRPSFFTSTLSRNTTGPIMVRLSSITQKCRESQAVPPIEPFQRPQKSWKIMDGSKGRKRAASTVTTIYTDSPSNTMTLNRYFTRAAETHGRYLNRVYDVYRGKVADGIQRILSDLSFRGEALAERLATVYSIYRDSIPRILETQKHNLRKRVNDGYRTPHNTYMTFGCVLRRATAHFSRKIRASILNCIQSVSIWSYFNVFDNPTVSPLKRANNEQ